MYLTGLQGSAQSSQAGHLADYLCPLTSQGTQEKLLLLFIYGLLGSFTSLEFGGSQVVERLD